MPPPPSRSLANFERELCKTINLMLLHRKWPVDDSIYLSRLLTLPPVASTRGEKLAFPFSRLCRQGVQSAYCSHLRLSSAYSFAEINILHICRSSSFSCRRRAQGVCNHNTNAFTLYGALWNAAIQWAGKAAYSRFPFSFGETEAQRGKPMGSNSHSKVKFPDSYSSTPRSFCHIRSQRQNLPWRHFSAHIYRQEIWKLKKSSKMLYGD